MTGRLALGDRLALAGEQRLVEVETDGGRPRPVDHHLVARSQYEQLVGDDLADRRFDVLAVATRQGSRGVEQFELVERAASPEFLHDADHELEMTTPAKSASCG